MYLRILKKDLTRKKTMNIILLLFIILAAMFVASSVNNIVTVTNALDYFFEQAGMPDFFLATIDKAQSTPLSEVIEGIEEVDSYGVEHILYMNPDNLIYKGEQLDAMRNTSVLLAFEDADLHYFDENDRVIEAVEPGTIWISGKRLKENNMAVGDTLTIEFFNVAVEFEIAGSFKDAALGSEMMGMTRFIISEKDFEKFKSDKEISAIYSGKLCYIRTSAPEAVEKELSQYDSSIIFLGGVDLVKMTYVMDMIIAGILLVVSVCLILIAFVVLRFTISFTLAEEYREIGVMKAIGISLFRIRGLYMAKYFFLAVVGASAGLLASIPFGNMLIKSISGYIVLGNAGGLFINIACAVLIVAVILLFCFGCTGKVKKFTPVDAIRSGTTGERFQKKGVLRLSKSPLQPAVFLAANDVLSSPKRFGTVILTFTICLSLVLILVNSVNTLKSDGLITAFGLTESDVYFSDEGMQMSFMAENGREMLVNKLEEMEKTLAEEGMPAECANEVMFKLTLVHGDNICKSVVFQGIGTTADAYEYFEGTPPQNEKEIAITPLIAEKLDAHIGDTVIIRQSDGEREYVVTAMFQSMNNMGEGVRLHESARLIFCRQPDSLLFRLPLPTIRIKT